MSELMNEEEVVLTEEEIRFTVDDDQKAEWCLDKIREAKAELEKWTKFYQERMDSYKKYIDNRIAFFEGMLQRYFETVPHKETKTQESYHLPSGKLVMKEQKPEWTHDDTQLLPWVKEYVPGFVKVKESVDWAEMKKDLTVIWNEDGTNQIVNADGLIVPGITVTERPDEFRVEVK